MANPRVVRSRIALFVAFFALVLTLISFSPAAAEPALPNLGTFTLQGRVYDGYPFDQSRPLQGVTVTLPGATNPHNDTGTRFMTTTTNAQGFYSFPFYEDDLQGYEFLSIRETNPTGYMSVDATPAPGGGDVKDDDWLGIMSLAGLSGWTAAARVGPSEVSLEAYTFNGHVYLGEPYDTNTPVTGVTVGLWGDDDEWPEGGLFDRVLLDSTLTDGSGAFSLGWTPAQTSYDYLHVIEVDPTGANSTGARVDDQDAGYVKNFNVVSFLDPGARTYTGIGFWDEQTETATPTSTPTSTPTPTPICWTFQGRVYEGEVGDESQPLGGVTVSVWGSNNPYPDSGTFIRSTTTNAAGWYGLLVCDSDGPWEFYHIIETNPAGYISVGATTTATGGTVRTSDWIEYEVPLEGKTLTGNKFWDRERDAGTSTLTSTSTNTPTNTPTATATPTGTVQPRAQADLQISKKMVVPTQGPVAPGGQIQYNLDVWHNGPDTATNVVVTDVLPPEVAYDASSGGCTLIASRPPNDVLRCELGDLTTFPPGTSIWLQVNVDQDACGPIRNVVRVESDTFDPDPTNNEFELDTQIGPCESTVTPTPTATLTPTVRSTPTVTSTPPPGCWTFEGRVYEGAVGDESQPLGGVTVTVYGSNNPYPDSGASIGSTTTDAAGWYGLLVCDNDGPWEFYHIIETNPLYYISVGATSVGGTVRTEDWIEYAVPLEGKTLTGNKFWDRERDAGTPTVTPTATPTEVLDDVDLEISKTFSLAEPVAAGSYGHYVLTIENHGPSVAYNVVITDSLPAEFAFDYGATQCTQIASRPPHDVVRCELSYVTPGLPVELTLYGTIDTDVCDRIHNVAEVQSDSPDHNLANNSTELFTQVECGGPTPTATEEPPETTPTATEEPPEITPTPTITGPLVTFPEGDWPQYAQEELSVHPEPPMAGRLTRLCAEVVNLDPANPHIATLEFRVAGLGIGLPWTSVGASNVEVPSGGAAVGCVIWTPPGPGPWCIEVVLHQEGAEPQRSQRNIDADEPLQPGVSHSRVFEVGNPFDHPVDISLGLVPHMEGWGLELDPDTLLDVAPGEIREFTLTVTPPQGEPLPPDGTVIVDVEAWAEGELIGGFRKIFRPPVPLHRFPDPPYAEGEITVHPYPVRAGEPTELCVELRNPTADPQDVMVQFSWANFGIGIPFTPISGPRPVHLPPYSIVKECLHWIPPVSGSVCIQVELHMEGYDPQRSQRNIDMDEPLQPGDPHSLTFSVGNPLDHTVDITLGLVPHLPNWGLGLSPDTLLDMAPGETRQVTLTVTPPHDEPLPPGGQVIVDVEAYVEGALIGGFRKTFSPPVSIHRPKDPVYAETEIGVDPYPIVPGQPVKLSVELRNPTDMDQIVQTRFSIAPFGIGLPFSDEHIIPNPIPIFVPAHGAARGHVMWYPPPHLRGKFCVQVTLEMEGQEPVWSRRNMDVGEPLRRGEPHALAFPIGSLPHTEPVTITLGLVNHRSGWQTSLSDYVLPNVMPGEPVSVTLTVTAPLGAELGTGEPIVDVEAYIGGELLGGFRKLDVPPVSVHKPHEKSYAETEIIVDPYPPQAGQETRVSAVLHNTGDVPVTVNVEFGWANFGLGIPFTNAGMVPPVQLVTLPPSALTSVDAAWTPTQSGHQCLLVRLTDPEGQLERQESQRNVDVAEPPPCGETKVFTFTVYNDSAFPVTVDIGMITFNVPNDWEVSTDPGGTVEIGPNDEVEIKVIVRIPCPPTMQVADILRRVGGGMPTIDVEGYIDGELAGGIQIQFGQVQGYTAAINLPLIMKGG